MIQFLLFWNRRLEPTFDTNVYIKCQYQIYGFIAERILISKLNGYKKDKYSLEYLIHSAVWQNFAGFKVNCI